MRFGNVLLEFESPGESLAAVRTQLVLDPNLLGLLALVGEYVLAEILDGHHAEANHAHTALPQGVVDFLETSHLTCICSFMIEICFER